MDRRKGNKSILQFHRRITETDVFDPRYPYHLLNTKVNSTAWRDKEPQSCVVIGFRQVAPVPAGDHTEFEVLVGDRPADWISDESPAGRRRRNGWKLELRHEREDGTLWNDRGKPLSAGAAPVYRPPFAVLEATDFNAVDFGDFLGEVGGGDVDGRPR